MAASINTVTADGHSKVHVGNNIYQSEDRCLKALSITDPRHDKKRIEDDKGGLLTGLCHWVLETYEFKRWRDDGRLLWVKGEPGKGKTMLMCSIINELEKEGHSLVYFFCQAGDERINNATAVLRSLIYLLVDQQRSLLRHVKERYDRVGERLFEDANAWFALSEIFWDILRDPALKPTYLLVDALDECQTPDRTKLINLVKSASVNFPHTKWITSSRNWPEIEEIFGQSDKMRLSLELKAHFVSAAVKQYINEKVGCLQERKKYDEKTAAEIRDILLSNAQDTFLWVAIVCHNLQEVRAGNAVKMLRTFPAGLDALYERMMQQIYRMKDAEDVDLCAQLLAIASCVYRPISLEELQSFIEGSSGSELKDIVELCGSFLAVRNRVVYFVHQSARDFLCDDKLNYKFYSIFPNGTEPLHTILLEKSILAMQQRLQYDIYRQYPPGRHFQAFTRPNPDPLAPVQYACVYWVDHFIDAVAIHDNIGDGEDIRRFLEEKCLNWIEALALLESISNGILAVSKLNTLFQAKAGAPIARLTRDAWRFLLAYRVAIEEAPLQVYPLALVFSPAKSLIRQQSKADDLPWIVRRPQMEDEWSACLSTLEGHNEDVNVVAWSFDSTLLASASDDCTIKIWDPAASRCVLELNQSHSGVTSIAWSYNAVLLASASLDTIKIWDCQTGNCVSTLKDYKKGIRSIRSIAWSRDSELLASALSDETISIWNYTTSVCFQTLSGHHHDLNAVAWSHNSALLASASSDQSIKIWDPATGKCIRTLVDHNHSVNAIAWSHDSAFLASASNDQSIKIWNYKAGNCTTTINGHSDAVRSIAWSHDSALLASGSDDQSIKIWDPMTGECISTLEGHIDTITSVAWSHDSILLASASADMSVKIWEPATRGYDTKLDRHREMVSFVSWSYDSALLASASYDSSIKVWDRVKCSCILTLQGHDSEVLKVAWSYKSTILASASHDDIKVWDVDKGCCISTFKGKYEEGIYLTWSYDSALLALKSDSEIIIRDYTMKRRLSRLDCSDSIISSITWSPDSTLLAVKTGDKFKVWNRSSNHWTSKRTPGLISLSWSHDSKLLTSRWINNTVEIWEQAAARNILTLKNLQTQIRFVAWSQQSPLLALLSDYNIQIWNRTTGHCVSTFSTQGEGDCEMVEFDNKNPSFLHTDFGTLNIPPIVESTVVTTEPAALQFHMRLGYYLDEGGPWITYGEKNLLWLPPDLRASRFDVSGAAVAIGCASGRVLIFEFADKGLWPNEDFYSDNSSEMEWLSTSLLVVY